MQFIILLTSILIVSIKTDEIIEESYYQSDYKSECYDSANNVAKKCMPEFTNAVYGLKIIASNTCGIDEPTEYCVQSNLHNLFISKQQQQQQSNNSTSNDFYSYYRNHPRCDTCDDKQNDKRHPAEYLNDYNNQGNLTWWQSETMLEGIQYPNSVNLTIHLGKSFEINYVQIKFYSPRPESFAIYKRTSEKSDWTPYQYYSASCELTYNVSSQQLIKYDNEAIALCTDEFSDIAPLTGASVVFGTLEDRPSAYNFDQSNELKEWVTATDIRITLNRLNTFGDEVFGDEAVLKSYYYAISGIAVGGRCKCNGHANKCVLEQQHDFEDRLKCDCQHNTAGIDCNECAAFYNDVPWEPATHLNAHECKPCDCNGLAIRCHFNQTLYDLTGRGGYCDDCQGNTQGANCDECKFGYYRRNNENYCINCQCNRLGAESAQCNPDGKCKCKPGVIGEKCDRCAHNHYDLTSSGCKVCSCNPAGSFDSPPVCEPINGFCRCKSNVEGQNCDRPKPGYFDLNAQHLHGALPCFCYGHSSQCKSAENQYVIDTLEAKFNDDISPNCFRAVDTRGRRIGIEYSNEINGATVYIPAPNTINDEIYFILSEQFLGNQLYSYNQELNFDMKLISTTSNSDQQQQSLIRSSRRDIIIESYFHNLEIYSPINTNNNALPSFDSKTFTFKLNQYSGWMPTLSSFDFQRLLSNISAIKIRASYIPMTKTFLNKLKLKTATAKLIKSSTNTTLHVEQCTCPMGYIGQHCDACETGYRREPINGGLFAKCVPCTCNNHSITCDQNTGKCDCIHHTYGDNCERCSHGYYGNPLIASRLFVPATSITGLNAQQTSFITGQSMNEYDLTQMCKKCPCPNGGSCAEIFNHQLQMLEIVCLECPLGTQGNLCELCDDGYFNLANSTLTTKCEKCYCNGNIDENAIGNCDSQSIGKEKCLRCIFNTTGDQCEKCLPNHWGSALTNIKCHQCNCFTLGTINNEKSCDSQTGQCQCKVNVKNKQCNECREGFYGIQTGNCEDCKCNPLGSFNLSCDSYNGQCYCRPGVTGKHCDQCKPLHYGYSDEGCRKCDCDPSGTVVDQLQCNDFGKCLCREGFSGLKCNQCDENRYNFTSGCLKCDHCYDLVQVKTQSLRSKIKLIETNLNQLYAAALTNGYEENEEPDLVLDELIQRLKSVKLLIEDFHIKLYVKRQLKSNYKESVLYLQNEVKKLGENLKSADNSFDQFNLQYKQLEKLFRKLNSSIYLAQTQLEFIHSKNKEKREQFETIKTERFNHDHNIKLQELSKQARETSQQQAHLVNLESLKFQKYLNDARKALQQLKDMSVWHERVDEEKQANILRNINYELIRNQSVNLVRESNEQKEILEVNIRESKELIKKLNAFKIPDIDNWEKLNKNNSDSIQNKYIMMKNEIDNLKLKFDQFSNVDSSRSISMAQSHLSNAKIKQNDIDYLFSLAEKTRNESNEANELTKQIFENATIILNTLKTFDQLILEGKEKMSKSLRLKPLIENKLELANTEANKFEKKIEYLNELIDSIKKISSQSTICLQNLNYTFDSLTNKVNELKNQIAELNEKTKLIHKTFNKEILVKSAAAITIYSNLNNRSEQIQKQSEQVTNRTQKLLDNANNGLENLNKINKSISDLSMSNLKRDDIERLQNKFDRLSNEISKNFDLDESILNLERKTKLSLNIALQYEYEVTYLKQQVSDLELLNRTLKTECYANTVVIPEL